MKKSLCLSTLSAIILAPFLTATSAYAVEGLSANAGITNNYLWRGLEQTNGDAAISGGIDYTTNSGFYLGTWVSNASWAPGMTYELDLYGGYTQELENFSYDVGFIYYAYLDSDADSDFNEIYASISVSVFTVGYSVLTSADGMDFADDSYLYVDADFDLGNDLGLNLHLGTATDDFYAGESFVEYGASINKNNFTLGISANDLTDSDVKVVVSYSIDIDL